MSIMQFVTGVRSKFGRLSEYAVGTTEVSCEINEGVTTVRVSLRWDANRTSASLIGRPSDGSLREAETRSRVLFGSYAVRRDQTVAMHMQ